MNINIKATSFELTPAIRDYVEKRLEAATRFLENDPAAMIDVEVGKVSSHHRHGEVFRAEAHVVASHRDIHVGNETADLYAAIDALRDELVHRLSADKVRRQSGLRRGGARIKAMVKGLWRGKRAAARDRADL